MTGGLPLEMLRGSEVPSGESALLGGRPYSKAVSQTYVHGVGLKGSRVCPSGYPFSVVVQGNQHDNHGF